MPRYRFSHFILSPRRRLLVRDGHELALIPRYFDLLVYLVEQRGAAVHRRDIFDRVWGDVVVSDSALSQAVRTIRRVLDDDPREPRFIRTISRHGYSFIFPDVVEEEDNGDWTTGESEPEAVPGVPAVVDPFEPLLERLTGATDEEDQREAAELLHGLGTEEALRRLGTRPYHPRARALLRDTRWDVAHAGAVPILGEPAAIAATRELVRLRLRRAAALVAARWEGASIGGGIAGLVAGTLGGLLLAMAPETLASMAVVPVLAAIGGAAGAAGGAGVGAGLAAAESVARSLRFPALIAGGAVGGGAIGYATQWLSRSALAALVGIHVPVGGGLEGIAIGAAAGVGYGLATRRAQGGLASPRGRRRAAAVAITAAACAIAALALALAGRPLVGGTIHALAEASRGSQATLTPLARMLGEPQFGRLTGGLIAAGEGAVFGIGLALGLMRRP